MKQVKYTTRFPSVSHPVYCEIHNDQGHIIYWNAFHTVEEMESFMRRLYYNETVVFKRGL